VSVLPHCNELRAFTLVLLPNALVTVKLPRKIPSKWLKHHVAGPDFFQFRRGATCDFGLNMPS
jgi:hypothetical protein